MTEAVRTSQRKGVATFSVSIERTEGGFDYEIRDLIEGVAMQEMAEALFSIALDIQAKSARNLVEQI